MPTDLRRTYCWGEFNSSDVENYENCDPYFAKYDLTLRNGFPGLGKKPENSSFSFKTNLYPKYCEEDDNIIDPIANHDQFDDPQPNRAILMNESSPYYNEEYHKEYPSWIEADITSSFTGTHL